MAVILCHTCHRLCSLTIIDELNSNVLRQDTQRYLLSAIIGKCKQKRIQITDFQTVFTNNSTIYKSVLVYKKLFITLKT